MKNEILSRVLIGFLAFTIFGMLVLICFRDFDTTSSSLIGILLTLISIIATWLFASLYSKSQTEEALTLARENHFNNLRTYAINAAEKVDTLSNELGRLSYFMKETISEAKKYDVDELKMLFQERISGLIQMVEILKSINNTYLNDWRGVIGEELKEFEEEKRSKEQELNEVLFNINNILGNENIKQLEDRVEINELISELIQIKDRMFSTENRLDDKNWVLSINKNCPNCKSKLLPYNQLAENKSYKIIYCYNCKTDVMSTWISEVDFILDLEVIHEDRIPCPWCNMNNIVLVSNFKGTHTINRCIRCESDFKITIEKNGTRIKKNGHRYSKAILSNEFIEEVKVRLPEQPWEKGMHSKIAEELQVSGTKVMRAINVLISNGDFKRQENGKVLE